MIMNFIFACKRRKILLLISIILVIYSCKKQSETALIGGNIISAEDSMPIANTRIYMIQSLSYYFSHPRYADDADSVAEGWRGSKWLNHYSEYYYIGSTVSDQNGFFEFNYDLHAVSKDNESDANITLFVENPGKWSGHYFISDPTSTHEFIYNWKIQPESTINLCIKDSGLNKNISRIYLDDKYVILNEVSGSDVTIYHVTEGGINHEIKYYYKQNEIIDSVFCPSHDTVTYTIYI
jgi:hypothetical protein